ncbi:hypothetical protein RB199_21030 [Streptomyces libani]
MAGAVRPAAEQTAPVTGRVTEPVSRVVREIGESAGAALPVHLPSGEHGEHPGDGGADQHGRTPGEDRPAGSRTAAPACGAAAADAVQSLDDLRKPVSEGPSATAHEQRDPGHDGLPGQYPQGPVAPASHTAGDGHGPRRRGPVRRRHGGPHALPAAARWRPHGRWRSDASACRRNPRIPGLGQTAPRL